MKNFIPIFYFILFFSFICPANARKYSIETIGAVSPHPDTSQEGISQLVLDEAIDILAKVEFQFPAEALELCESDDGLPGPNDPQFATNASRFMTEHPVPSADRQALDLWNVRNMASRQLKCLAYLAKERQEARHEVASLCLMQAMRLQWMLPIQSGNGNDRINRTFNAAVGALSFTGGLLQNNVKKEMVTYDVATQWLRTGVGQSTSYDKRGNENERLMTKALIEAASVNNKDLEIQGSEQEFFSQIDLEHPDMREVSKNLAAGNLQGAKHAYVDALSERFSRKHGWPDINSLKELDIADADDNCRNIFVLRAHMFRRVDFGEEVDWAKVIDNDIESRVWMNAHPWILTLLTAYQATGNEKYVKHLCRLFNSWYETSPPTFKRTSAQWRTLEAGGRSGLKWGVVLLELSQHPAFKRECLFNMARSMMDHGKYLSMYAANGSNWLQVESSGLACVALLFPEFKLSPLFYNTAMKRLAWVNAGAFLPDGFQSEGSPHYHRFPLTTMSSALKLARYLSMPIPKSLLEQYEEGVEAMQYIAYPDITLPMLSDADPERFPAVEVMEAGAAFFERNDFRWFATNGREGKPPVQPSHDFTHAGYCVMRDKWGPDGQVLIFDAGYFGSGHQHEDKLNFVYYAGGRELIGDPSIYSYKPDEFEPYWRGSWSHNTIVIDGLSQHRALGPPEVMPDPDRRFVIGERFDFGEGWYRRAYSPRTASLWGSKSQDREADKNAAIRDAQHQRCIFYLKGQYAIVCDRVLGEGKHQVDLLFHPAPIIQGEGVNRKAHAVQLEINPNNSVVTKETDHTNVAILPAQGERFETIDIIGQTDPVRGWFALFAITPSHDIIYRCHQQLPLHFETVIQALPPGEHEIKKVQSSQVISEQSATCAALTYDDDLFLISYDGPEEMTCGEVRFHGTALLLRTDEGGGGYTQAFMVDGEQLTINGELVFSTENPTPARSFDLR